MTDKSKKSMSITTSTETIPESLSPSHKYNDPEAELITLRRLWVAVVDQVISDALIEDQKDELYQWLLSGDYDKVVELAQIADFKEDLFHILQAKGAKALVLADQLKRRILPQHLLV